MQIDLNIGPIVTGDGQVSDRLRVGQSRELIVSDYRGRFAEAAARGELFDAITALVGTTIVAGNVAPPAAAAATVLSVFNPEGSGVDLEVLIGWLMHISGTPGAGAWAWCGARAMGATAITAAQNNNGVAAAGPFGTRIPSGASKAKAYTQTALTAGPLHTLARPFPSAQFAGALAATTPNQVIIDEVAGAIVVQPGGVVTLAPPAIGTTHIVAAGIMWQEKQRPNP